MAQHAAKKHGPEAEDLDAVLVAFERVLIADAAQRGVSAQRGPDDEALRPLVDRHAAVDHRGERTEDAGVGVGGAGDLPEPDAVGVVILPISAPLLAAGALYDECIAVEPVGTMTSKSLMIGQPP